MRMLSPSLRQVRQRRAAFAARPNRPIEDRGRGREVKLPHSVPLGVICAMPEEIEHLAAATEVEIGGGETRIGGFVFRSGRLDGRPVVLVESGIGKVSAAHVATLLLDRFGCRSLVLSGVAGGLDPDLGIGDVVVAERLIQHDYGAMVDGELRHFRPGVVPLGESRHDPVYRLAEDLRDRIGRALDGFVLPTLPAAATGGEARRPRLVFGTVLTGDQFINCEATRRRLFDRFDGHAVEMEGAAVAQVAERYGAPCVIVRSLSDLAGGESHMDIATFLHSAAAQAAAVVRRILPAL